MLAARCSAEDGRLRLGPAPGTEYSIVVYGRVRVTPAAAGTHPSAPALTGPARFLVPSGSSITATFTPDLSLTGASSADEVPVCLGSLAAPLAGRYELQLPTSTSAPASVAFTVPATLDPAPVVPAAPPDQPTVVVPNAQPATGGGSSTGTTKPRATTTSTAFSFGSLSPTKITKSAGTNGLVTMTIRYSNLPKFPDMRASMSGQSGDKNMNAETSPSPASGSTSATFKIAYVCNSTGTATQPLTVRELTTGASKSFQVTLVCT